MNPAANTTSRPEVHFQALLHLQARGRWSELLEHGQQLLLLGLTPQQRALVLQLLGEAAMADGDRGDAELWLEKSLLLQFMPQTALQWLELVWPEWVWQEADLDDQQCCPSWIPVCQQLVCHGHGELLLRSLMGLLAQLPLEGQRLELVETMERWDGLLLSSHPVLGRQWSWLRRAAASGGQGMWA